MADRWCADVEELIPELALGVAPGDERGRALAHVDGCRDCRARLARAAALADDLLALAPEHEPSPGFDTRVLAAMQPVRRRRVVPVLLAAAAALLLVLGTFAVTRTLGPGQEDRPEAALESTSGVSIGRVFAHEGDPSWIFMTVQGAPSGYYAVRLVTDDGRSHSIGWCRVEDGTAAWGTAVDVPVASIDHVEMTAHGTTFRADLPG
jgi:hypothetical protein